MRGAPLGTSTSGRGLRVLSSAACLAAACALLPGVGPSAARAAEEAAPPAAGEPEVVGGEWLAIGGVDARGRAPFNPDTLLARYLLDASAPPPRAGDPVTGTTGETAEWVPIAADEKGFVAGDIALAYRRLDSPTARIVLADLPGGSVLVANGVPYVGDVYGGGFGPVPVALREGANDLWVRGVRGRFRLTLTTPEAEFVLTGRDSTVPDLVEGAAYEGEAAVVVANCSDRWLVVDGASSGGGDSAFAARSARNARSIPPLGILKVPVPLALREPPPPGIESLPLLFSVSAHFRDLDGAVPGPLVSGSLSLAVRKDGDARRVTFRSAVDGSVQEYSVRPPVRADADRLVLSIHGAGVDALGQARSYSRKPSTWIVAATNRRPFGFDWQDWGRADAYEVLADALSRTRVPRRRVCLTGHSMGGHGTWHLAANDPDGFAAIAPSAGWSQFDHYGGRPEQASREPWYGADAASDTLSLLDNLVQVPTFVLHGTDDDNVPISEAERMLAALRAAGAAPQSHFQEGAGHWWDGDAVEGADCVDWPGIFAHFDGAEIPDSPRAIRWTTVDPGVDAEHHWVRVEQPRVYGRRVHVEGSWDPGTHSVDLVTDNAGLLRVIWPGEGGLRSVRIDGSEVVLDGAPRVQWLRRGRAGWSASAGPAEGEKTAARSGPLKRAFGNRFVLVAGTAGTAPETAALVARARYDAETWRYRGNGLSEVVADDDFLAGDYAGRNVVLYGNADTNRAWSVLLADAPVDARRGAVTVGRQTWERDDLAAVVVQRRSDDPSALVAAFTDSGPRGAALHAALLVFVSGVGYPDWAVFTPAVLEKGDGGVLSAGWFDRRWQVQGEAPLR